MSFHVAPPTRTLIDAGPEEALRLLAGMDWHGTTRLHASLGLACMRGEVDQVLEILEAHPHLAHESCSHWRMRPWFEKTAVSPPVKAGMHPFEVALVCGQYGVCLALLARPDFDPGRGLDGRLHYGNLLYISLFFPEKKTEAVDVFAALHRRGDSLFERFEVAGPDASQPQLPLPCALCHLVDTGITRLDFLKAALAAVDLSGALSMGQGEDFRETWGHLEQTLGKTPMSRAKTRAGHDIGACRHVEILDNVMDWLLLTGWRDPVLLDMARLYRPGVLAFDDRQTLESGMPAAGVPRSPVRL